MSTFWKDGLIDVNNDGGRQQSSGQFGLIVNFLGSAGRRRKKEERFKIKSAVGLPLSPSPLKATHPPRVNVIHVGAHIPGDAILSLRNTQPL